MIQFTYTNHRGETQVRHVTPVALCFLHNPASVSPHLTDYNAGLFLECITHDRNNELRHFACDRILEGMGAVDWRMTFSHPNEDMAPALDIREYREGFTRGMNCALYTFGSGEDWTKGYNDGRRARVMADYKPNTFTERNDRAPDFEPQPGLLGKP